MYIYASGEAGHKCYTRAVVKLPSSSSVKEYENIDCEVPIDTSSAPVKIDYKTDGGFNFFGVYVNGYTDEL